MNSENFIFLSSVRTHYHFTLSYAPVIFRAIATMYLHSGNAERTLLSSACIAPSAPRPRINPNCTSYMQPLICIWLYIAEATTFSSVFPRFLSNVIGRQEPETQGFLPSFKIHTTFPISHSEGKMLNYIHAWKKSQRDVEQVKCANLSQLKSSISKEVN